MSKTIIGRLAARPYTSGDALPAIGSMCFVSGANCDVESDQHRSYSWRKVIGYGDDNMFIALQTPNCWPTIERTENCWFAEILTPLTGAAAQPAQEPVASDDDSDALTIAYMQGFSDGKAAARAATPSPQESAAAARKDGLTEQEVRNFLAQFDKAREDFNNWPKWMQDAARVAAATFPRSSGVDSPDGEQR